ncbi:hypothetical protein TAL182_CH03003 [Rhizobium sp. TAL182]|uniref:hypothetical protein n=1 Tax=Rhizobium sp. TAL182 TaxID=2020313 RepID=UPI000A2113CC|nr:hypothetical protein [Rhizobium sp. TAL182]ARO24749.1 hypothetical protein TAL182_CH03003 [Rhizobium sp. TAL182]
MTEKPIAYEPHPVSPERKAELVAAGFKIVDAVYAPKSETVALREDGPTVEEYVAAGYLAANYPPSGYASRSTPDEIAAAIAAQAGANGGGTDTGIDLSDEQLHAAIKAAAGKAPHPKTGRDKLLAQYNALKAAE